MVDNVKVGPQTLTDGATAIMRAAKDGSGLVGQAHARYYEQTVRDKCFFAANTGVVTTTVGLATTYTGLALSNPINSAYNLVVHKATMMQSVIQATQPEAYGIATGYNASTNVTHTTPVTPKPCLIGSSSVPNGLADSSATLPTAPVYTAFMAATSTATANPTMGFFDFEGSIVLRPGAYICWVTPTQASVNGMWFSFMWEEVAV